MLDARVASAPETFLQIHVDFAFVWRTRSCRAIGSIPEFTGDVSRILRGVLKENAAARFMRGLVQHGRSADPQPALPTCEAHRTQDPRSVLFLATVDCGTRGKEG